MTVYLNADGSAPGRITNTPGTSSRPKWSPNGARIAFDDGLEISTVRPDGSGRAFHLEGGGPSWAPNGDDLWSYFIYYDEFLEDYYTGFQILNVETGAYDQTEVGGHSADPVVSPNGHALLFGILGSGSRHISDPPQGYALPGGGT